jgi:hypothetical protein
MKFERKTFKLNPKIYIIKKHFIKNQKLQENIIHWRLAHSLNIITIKNKIISIGYSNHIPLS